MSKQRLSASVDRDLLTAVEKAVSAWVNDALHLKLAQERRLEALAAFVTAYEKEHGEITAEEMQMAARRARQRAVVVRSRAPVKTRSAGRRAKSK